MSFVIFLKRANGVVRVVFRDRERNIRVGRAADILDDHVDVDVVVSQRFENSGGHPRFVRHAAHGELGLVLVA